MYFSLRYVLFYASAGCVTGYMVKGSSTIAMIGLALAALMGYSFGVKYAALRGIEFGIGFVVGAIVRKRSGN